MRCRCVPLPLPQGLGSAPWPAAAAAAPSGGLYAEAEALGPAGPDTPAHRARITPTFICCIHSCRTCTRLLLQPGFSGLLGCFTAGRCTDGGCSHAVSTRHYAKLLAPRSFPGCFTSCCWLWGACATVCRGIAHLLRVSCCCCFRLGLCVPAMARHRAGDVASTAAGIDACRVCTHQMVVKHHARQPSRQRGVGLRAPLRVAVQVPNIAAGALFMQYKHAQHRWLQQASRTFHPFFTLPLCRRPHGM